MTITFDFGWWDVAASSASILFLLVGAFDAIGLTKIAKSVRSSPTTLWKRTAGWADAVNGAAELERCA